MSRSTTYRPIELTAEERAELERKAHALQLAEDVLPHLRSRWETNLRRAAASLGERGGLPAKRVEELQLSLQSAASLDDMRAAAAEIVQLERDALPRGEAQLPTRPIATGGRSTSAPSTNEQSSSTELTMFDIDFVEAEFAALARAARELNLTADAADESLRAVDEARLLLLDRRPVDASIRLDEAADAMSRLRAEIDETRAQTECQERTANTVVATLTRLGFDVSQSVDGSTISISALAADGREATVELAGGDGATVLVTADVDDPGSSVPDGDPAAGEVCIGAATVGVEVHRDLGRANGLEAGQVTAAGRPTRGQPSAVANRRRRSANTTTRYRTRGVQ